MKWHHISDSTVRRAARKLRVKQEVDPQQQASKSVWSLPEDAPCPFPV